MKKIVLTVLLASVLPCFASEKNSSLSAEGRLKVYKLSNGIPVYVLPNTENQIDSVAITTIGGISYYDEDHSGIENALFTMMASGSKNYPKKELQSINYRTGISISCNASVMSAYLSLNCINQYMEEGLYVLTDCFMNPDFNQNQYALMMNNYQQQLQSTFNDPFQMGIYFGQDAVFKDTVLSVKASPTPASLNNITIPDMQALLEKEKDARRIAVFAITAYEPEKLVSVLEQTLGTISKREEPLLETVFEPITKFPAEDLNLIHPSAGNSAYVYRFFRTAELDGEDYLPMALAEQVYSKILFSVVRTKYGACYTPMAGDFSSALNLGYEIIYRCSDEKNIRQYMKEARDIMTEGKIITGTKEDGSFVFADLDTKLEGYKNSLINQTYASQSVTVGRLSRLMTGVLLHDDPFFYEKRAEQIREVTKDQILDVFKKYYCTDNDFWIKVSGE